jgi:hypothetical protein
VQADGFTVESSADVSRVRVLVGERAVLGAIVMGDQTLSRPLQDIIRGQVDIRPVRQDLLRAPQDLPAILKAVWRNTRASE